VIPVRLEEHKNSIWKTVPATLPARDHFSDHISQTNCAEPRESMKTSLAADFGVLSFEKNSV